MKSWPHISPPFKTLEICFLLSKVAGIFTAIYVASAQITKINKIRYQIMDISRGFSVSCPYRPAINIVITNPIQIPVKNDDMTIVVAS